MRFKMMSKKFADALLEEEVKDDIMDKNKRHKTAMAATPGGAFKTPQQPSTPPRMSSSMQQRMEAVTTSASSNG
jgi:hypothetical protein